MRRFTWNCPKAVAAICTNSSLRASALALLLSVALGAEPCAAWNIHCDDKLLESENCFISQSVVAKDNNNIGGSILFGFQSLDRRDNSSKLFLRVIVPYGVPEERPLVILTNEQRIGSYFYNGCRGDTGCYVDVELTEDVRAKLEKSQILQVLYHLSTDHARGLPFQLGPLEKVFQDLQSAEAQRIEKFGTITARLEYVDTGRNGECLQIVEQRRVVTSEEGFDYDNEFRRWFNHAITRSAKCTNSILNLKFLVSEELDKLWKRQPEASYWLRADSAIARLQTLMMDNVASYNGSNKENTRRKVYANFQTGTEKQLGSPHR